MKTSKKILSCLMALMILFTALPINVRAGGWMPGEKPEDYGLHSYKDFVYEKVKGGYGIKYYNGKKSTVTLPSKINGKKVIRITGYGKIKNLHVPNGIKIYNIEDTVSLKKITVNKSNKEYSVKNNMLFNKKKTVLYWCPRDVVNPKIPKSVKTIESRAFFFSKVRKITIPENVKTIGDEAFQNCKNLKEVKFNKGLRKIERNAFAGCSVLKSMILPDSVQTIEGGAFGYCRNLEHVKLSNNLKEVGMIFTSDRSIKELEIPKSVTLIDIGAFSFLDSLKKVYIYNKDCKIKYNIDIAPKNIVVYGYQNSTAEKYAEETGNEFVALP